MLLIQIVLALVVNSISIMEYSDSVSIMEYSDHSKSRGFYSVSFFFGAAAG